MLEGPLYSGPSLRREIAAKAKSRSIRDQQMEQRVVIRRNGPTQRCLRRILALILREMMRLSEKVSSYSHAFSRSRACSLAPRNLK